MLETCCNLSENLRFNCRFCNSITGAVIKIFKSKSYKRALLVLFSRVSEVSSSVVFRSKIPVNQIHQQNVMSFLRPVTHSINQCFPWEKVFKSVNKIYGIFPASSESLGNNTEKHQKCLSVKKINFQKSKWSMTNAIRLVFSAPFVQKSWNKM